MIAVFWIDATFHPVPCLLATILIRLRKTPSTTPGSSARPVGHAGERLIDVQFSIEA
jgi:hypothetical protein